MDMLTFSKEREPDLCPADLNQVVSDVIELSQMRSRDLEVDLVWKPAEGIPTLAPGESIVLRVPLAVPPGSERQVAWITLATATASLTDLGSPPLQLATRDH